MSGSLATEPSLLGDVLDDRYEIRALLGRGGMGEVYEAVDRQLDRTVAVKVLRPEWEADDRFLTRFRREARTSARLAHPGIVGVHDIGDHDGRTFIVMEFVPGRNLSAVMREEGRLPPARAARIAAAIADALAHAHVRGVVHSDVSPGNIMLTDTGEVKILDFGIARAGASARSGSGSAHGTLAYAAPELVRGEPADQRADIYALGAVLSEMLTGSPPHPPAAVSPVQPHLDAIVMHCLAISPALRYANAQDLARDLRTLEPALRRMPVTYPAPRSKGRRDDTTAVIDHPTTRPLPAGLAAAPVRRRGPARTIALAAVIAMFVGGSWLAWTALNAASRPITPQVHGPRPVPAPSGLSVTTSCDGFASTGADIAWTPGGPSSGYEVWRQQPGSGGFQLVAKISDPRSTSFRDVNLGIGTTYRYRVLATQGPRVSAPTAAKSADTPVLCLT